MPYNKKDALAALRQFLLDNNVSFDQIVAELRQTPEYKAAYPENDLRKGNGYDWWSEAQIRAYRSTARQLSSQYLGYNPSNKEIADAIANNRSLDKLAHRMQVYKDFQRWGPTVKK